VFALAENTMSRLSDEDVDALADFLEETTKTGSGQTFTNHGLTHDRGRKLGIMRVADYPSSGLQTAISFGLFHQSFTAFNFPDRIELVMTWDSEEAELERLLVVVAETIIMRGRAPKPGAIYVNATKIANIPALSARMPHALVMFPFLWRDGLVTATLPGARVWFMQVVPIHEKEREFIERNGFKKFQELLSYDIVDLHRVNRASHVV
jgi:hypothetical protein